MFPKINHINEILPLIEDKPEFKHGVRDGFQFIDYTYQDSETFNHPTLSECRGLKFDQDGNILARPFHKFHNYGENKAYSEIDFTKSYCILDKLDGSMIHPAIVKDQLVFMTRMGITDQAKAAFQLFGHLDNYARFCNKVLTTYNSTPIFEYTGPDNRIVIKYDEPQLTLLDIRNTVTGEYWSKTELTHLASMYELPVVEGYNTPLVNIDDLLRIVKDLRDKEGVVVRFDNGFKVKIKADDYVLKHRALAFFNRRDAILDLFFENKIDDILPLLDQADRDKIIDFVTKVKKEISANVFMIQGMVLFIQANNISRKEVALKYAPVNKPYAPTLFSALDGKNITDVMYKHMNKNRDLIRVEW